MKKGMLHHIGIAVENLTEALKAYESLGLSANYRGKVVEQKVEAAALPIGEIRLELLEPISDDSPVNKFLEKKGQGLHHLAFEVEDIEYEIKRLKDKGFKMIDENPRIGLHGMRIAFVHPKSTYGTLIELVENPQRKGGGES